MLARIPKQTKLEYNMENSFGVALWISQESICGKMTFKYRSKFRRISIVSTFIRNGKRRYSEVETGLA